MKWIAYCSMVAGIALAGCGDDGGEESPVGANGYTVASCEAYLDVVIENCTDASRLCNSTGFRPNCQYDPGATEAIFRCLTETSCQTPSDPSGSVGCLNQALEDFGTPATAGVRATVEGLCPGDEHTLRLLETIAVSGSDTHAATLQACLDEAADCDGAFQCVYASGIGVEFPDGC